MKYAQPIEKLDNGRYRVVNDWFPGVLPDNMVAEEMVYFDTSYSFASFHSTRHNALQLGYASGNYARSNIVSGKNGILKIGSFVILEATNLICNEAITIGDHCMFSWGSVVTDSWLDMNTFDPARRKKMLDAAAASENRYLEFDGTKPVIIEDNVWVGFDAVVLPGVKIGRGAVIGCKTIITQDVPPYAVVVGDPAKIVRYLHPDDTIEVRQKALREHLRK